MLIPQCCPVIAVTTYVRAMNMGLNSVLIRFGSSLHSVNGSMVILASDPQKTSFYQRQVPTAETRLADRSTTVQCE
jgi:hypothetical protein